MTSKKALVAAIALVVLSVFSCANDSPADISAVDTGKYIVTGSVYLSTTATQGNWQVYLTDSITSTTPKFSGASVGTITAATTKIDFAMTDVPAGTYYLVAVLDWNGDGKIGGASVPDMQGVYGPNLNASSVPNAANFHVSASANLSGITFSMYTF